MSSGPLDAYDRVVAIGGSPAHAARVTAMRATFEARAGRFAPDDAWFEARSRAFWDDAVTRQGFARAVAAELPDAARAWVAPLERAHRGVFRVDDATAGSPIVAHDLWSGATFAVDLVDDSGRAAFASAGGSGLVDARVVAALSGAHADGAVVAILPGALFHPADATDAIVRVLDAARDDGRATDDVLDALLRMERTLRSLSRVKPAYAYKPEALGAVKRG